MEIGVEIKGKGENSTNNVWKLGIENPEVPVSQGGDSLMKIVKFNNKALSTSGNTVNFIQISLVINMHTS